MEILSKSLTCINTTRDTARLQPLEMTQIIDELEDCAFRVNVTLSKAQPFNDTNSGVDKVNV